MKLRELINLRLWFAAASCGHVHLLTPTVLAVIYICWMLCETLCAARDSR